jgi:hypothetical protein
LLVGATNSLPALRGFSARPSTGAARSRFKASETFPLLALDI